MSLASMTTVPPNVLAVGIGHPLADRRRQSRRDGVGVLGAELGRDVGRVDGVLRGPVDGADVAADEVVEEPALADELADGPPAEAKSTRGSPASSMASCIVNGEPRPMPAGVRVT